jgi:aminoglycoside phosphotransferase (APT) family kinase protein
VVAVGEGEVEQVTVSSDHDVASVRPGEEQDWAALEAYLRRELPGLEGPFEVRQFPAGSANLTFQVRFGDRRLVVRRPPLGDLAPGSHDMRREHRVLTGLNPAYPRAPRALLLGDPAVLGVEFLVSEYRSGYVVWDHVPDGLCTAPDASRRIGLATVDALADLHALNPGSCGLSSLGRPDGYVGRQVAGWTKRWSAVEGQSELDDHAETVRVMREVGRRLGATLPAPQVAGFVHNDFKIDNCQFSAGDPDVVTSVFDWDMATTGDPLCDLGTLLNYWPDHTLPEGSVGAFIATSATRELDLPSRAEVIARYAERSSLDLSALAWYEALGCWKTAVILHQLYARGVRGESTDPRMLRRGASVRPLVERALALTDPGR